MNLINVKLAKRDLVPQIKTSALLVCFLSRERERIEVRASLWERARREGDDHGESLFHRVP